MAKAAALYDWTTLDRLFRRDFILSCGLYVVGAVVVIGIAIAL